MLTALCRAVAFVAIVFLCYLSFYTSNSVPNIETDEKSSADDGPEDYHLAGLVLARGGSKGIPRKNLVEINGRPLVGRALDAMIESSAFDSIWVSTDDPEIGRWVTNHYPKDKLVSVHKRAAYTATDTATSISAVLEFLNFHPEVDAIGLVQATSPFVQAEYLKQAANKLFGNGTFQSVFSVTRTHQLRWTVEGIRLPEGDVSTTKPMNFNPHARPRRQDWSGEMVENGMFYFAKRPVLVGNRVFQANGASSYVEIPKHLSIEIDTYDDLEVARCLAQRIDGDFNIGLSGQRNQLDLQNINKIPPSERLPGKSSKHQSNNLLSQELR